jgi:hypothetical protein
MSIVKGKRIAADLVNLQWLVLKQLIQSNKLLVEIYRQMPWSTFNQKIYTQVLNIVKRINYDK